jgi:photosystem II stability/assembly factor-like uncharacterized protein
LPLLVINASIAPAARWTDASTGLTGSLAGARALVIDSTGSTLYVQSGANAVFRSTDGGSSWSLLGSITGVNVLALDPTSPSTVYAGTANGVWKTTDGGASWLATGLTIGTPVTQLAVNPSEPSTLFAAGTGDHLFKSTDGGESWSAFALGLPPGPNVGITFIAFDPLTPSTVYVQSRSPAINSALYKSLDGGDTWNVIDPGPFVSLLAIDPSTPSTLYAIRPPAGFSRSTDGGTTWTPIYVKDFDCKIQFPCRSIFALAVVPGNSSTLYAAASAPVGTPPAIYKSTDAGQNWSLLNMTLPIAQSLVLNPANPSVVYAVNYKGGVFKTSDAGTTWSESNNGLRVLGIHLLAGDPSAPATIYAAGDEGLFQSVDGGASWSQRMAFQVTCCTLPMGLPPPNVPLPPPVASSSVQSLLIDFTNPNILYAGTHRTDGCFFSDILLFKSTDEGTTWSNSITPDQSGCEADAFVAMDPTDSNTLYLRWGNDFYDGFSLRKSTDGGATWSFTRLASNAPFALVIDPASPATLYAGTEYGVVRSTDGGVTWLPTGLAKTNVNLLAIDPLRPSVLYASTVAGYSAFAGILKSSDGGETWSPVNTGLEDLLASQARVDALILNPDHTDVLYLGTSGYGVFKSEDGGATWAACNEGLTNLDVRALAIVRGDGVYAGTPGGVYKIVENGPTPQ